MKSCEKLEIILEYKKLSKKDVAEALDVTSAFVSKWFDCLRNDFKKMHQYALSSAFNIPLEVFKDNINTKEEIIAILKKHQNNRQNNQNINLDDVVGTWNLYVDNKVDYKFVITKDLRCIYNRNGKEVANNGNIKKVGKDYIIEFNIFEKPLIIAFPAKHLEVRIFRYIADAYATNEDLVGIGVMSKKELDKEVVKYILNKEEENIEIELISFQRRAIEIDKKLTY
jgi:predicted transcriptional regulator